MPAAPAAVKTLFLEVVAIDDPVARAALLNERCGEDAALFARVNALLVANDRAVANEGTATFGPAGDAPTASFPGKNEHVGAILAGKYKLIEEIGEGGMGSGLAWPSRPSRSSGSSRSSSSRPGWTPSRCSPGSRPSGRRWP